MFLQEMHPDQLAFGDPDRLATFGQWENYYNHDLTHPDGSIKGTPESREAWAKLSATRDAIHTGWTTGDEALDMSIAISSYPEHLNGTAGKRRARILEMASNLSVVEAGDLLVSVDHRAGLWGPKVRMGVLDDTRLKLSQDADSFRESRLVIGTNGSHLHGIQERSVAGVDIEPSIVALPDDLPVHGMFRREDEERFRPVGTDYVPLGASDRDKTYLLGPSEELMYEVQIGIGVEAAKGMMGIVKRKDTIEAHNRLMLEMAGSLGFDLAA